MEKGNEYSVEETVSGIQEQSGQLKIESEFPLETDQEQNETFRPGVEISDKSEAEVIYPHSQCTEESQEDEGQENSNLGNIHAQDVTPDSRVENIYERESRTSSYDSMASHYHRSVSEEPYCDECLELNREVASPDSRTFWHEIPCKGMTSSRCHVKSWSEFEKKLKERYPSNTALKSQTTMTLLRSLLHCDKSDPAATVEYKRFVDLMKFFGPLLYNDGVMLDQLYNIASKSLTKRSSGGRSEKVSWFAGKIPRDKAEDLLFAQQNRTYLVRMSETREASFVISVKDHGVIEHFEITQDYREAAKSSPFDAKLYLNSSNSPFSNLVDAVKSLLSYPLTVEKDEEDKNDNSKTDDEEFWCTYVCPRLPLNGIIKGYRKVGGRK